MYRVEINVTRETREAGALETTERLTVVAYDEHERVALNVAKVAAEAAINQPGPF